MSLPNAATIGATLLALAGFLRTQGGPSTRPAADASPPGRSIPLSRGELFVPDGLRPQGDRVDLVVHFHGSPRVAKRALVESGWNAVLLAVSLPGLSRIYEEAFSPPGAFGSLLDEALAALRKETGFTRAAWGRRVLSSFSAGYAAIREALKDPAEAEKVDAVILADSLHAGYEAPRKADSRQMAPFRAFAARAAKGERVLLATHSAVVPQGYASTTETADDLIAAAGARRETVSGGNEGGMALSSRATKGKFVVLGYDGATGADHMAHLHSLANLYRLVPSMLE